MLDWNQKQWATAGVSVSYTRDQQLYAPEAVVLEWLGAGFRDTRIMDVGVGGGRTTSHLLKISADYIGIDYVEPMVRECRRLYPGIKFDVADARNLSGYMREPFDFVMFSFNGIDNLDHADRLKCLTEIRNVTRAGGAFVFSTHNRNRESIPRPWSFEHFDLKRNPTFNPLKLARRSLNYATGHLNHMRLSQRQRFTDEYAIINDNGDQYRFLSYHISPDQQIAQLAKVGFEVEMMIDAEGRILNRDTSGTKSDSWMIYYVCRPRGNAQ